MRIVIEDINPLDLEEFASYLIVQAKQNFLRDLDPSQLVRFQNFLEKHCSFFKKAAMKNKITYNIKNIAIGAISNLELHISHGACVIRINPNVWVLNLPIKYVTIAKLINYGNTATAAYPIFTQVFEEIERNLSEYYARWLFEE